MTSQICLEFWYIISRVRGRLIFFKSDHMFRFYDRKCDKNAHFWGRQLNRKWRSENQRAAISTHNKSEKFGILLVGIGPGEDLERLLNKKLKKPSVKHNHSARRPLIRMEPVVPLWNISGYFRPGLLALRSSTIRIFRMLKLFRISGAPPSAGRSTLTFYSIWRSMCWKMDEVRSKKTYKSPLV